jgi:hypothetical protein
MDPFLRKVIHSAAPENYRVVIRDGDEIEVGSIGRQFTGWSWGIDCMIPMYAEETEGVGKDRKDCMRQFRAAWDRFSADQARLTEFLEVKRKRVRSARMPCGFIACAASPCPHENRGDNGDGSHERKARWEYVPIKFVHLRLRAVEWYVA